MVAGRGLPVNTFQQVEVSATIHTWRIIPLSKWLVTPIDKPWKGHLEGEQPYLGDFLATLNTWDDPPSTPKA